MQLFGPVLVGTDLSAASSEALLQGRALARDLRTPLAVCHVIPEAYRVRVLFPHTAGIDDKTQQALWRTAEAATRMQLRAVLGSELDETQLLFDTGSAHAGILKLADRAGAGLIVLGPGATAQHVTRSAGQPVLVARPSPASGAVLGATDFSDPAVPAVRMAASEAQRRGAALRLIHCLDLDATAYLAAAGASGMMAAVPFPDSAIRQLETDAREHLLAASAPAEADAVVSRLSPYAGIVYEATHTPTALVVAGTHGRSGLARLALGSVAEHVLRNAPCSVLIVPLRH